MGYSQALEEQMALLSRMKATDWEESPVVDAAGLTIDLLDAAEAYFWAGPLCGVIQSAASEIPDSWRWRPEACPTPAGFLWFDRVIGFTAAPVVGAPAAIRALGWQFFRDTDGERKLAIAVFTPEGLAGRPRPYMAMTLSSTESIRDAVERMMQTSFSNELGADLVAACGLSTLGACLTFLEQRILVTTQERAERHARKRLERAGYVHEPLIRVVELRRKQTRSERGGESDPVEWSCQWVVSGHWRQQWYPSLNTNQPVWIMPYVKGPEDAPLKPPRAKVFAVVR